MDGCRWCEGVEEMDEVRSDFDCDGDSMVVRHSSVSILYYRLSSCAKAVLVLLTKWYVPGPCRHNVDLSVA